MLKGKGVNLKEFPMANRRNKINNDNFRLCNPKLK